MKELVKKIGDNTDKHSIAHQFRARRFAFFLSLLNKLPRPISILDIGGTLAFWDAMEFREPDVEITLLNLSAEPVNRAGFRSIQGDATALSFTDKSFDIVFSNSVIEHLYDTRSQEKMAGEVRRVGRHYFIQTPNYWFPMEPHWLFPFFQFLPVTMRVFLTRHFALGHIKKIRNKTAAEKQVSEIKLLTRAEMEMLFPEAGIHSEKFLGLTKSFVAYRF
ncbi:class I SAM-dependent methyltransferase [Sediminibacterium soli]|uniref:class I SAM-dependent methyltransferase n=1 Tax=Sediminibacterium soli TaxID=2698829 RepID=UPI00137A85AC|nr:class I SAM-dependent methyltransferase [Sediminibacterium soli]NCI48059.1 class I SAM-dependent methyltransferase [Sediminibacterium soli]